MPLCTLLRNRLSARALGFAQGPLRGGRGVARPSGRTLLPEEAARIPAGPPRGSPVFGHVGRARREEPGLRASPYYEKPSPTIQPDAAAIPAGKSVMIVSGDVDESMKGPASASQVLDAILKLERREPVSTVYASDASDAAEGCAACPRQGFCGIRRRGTSPSGMERYEVLWSGVFCHMGLTMSLEFVFQSPDFFSPARGATAACHMRKHTIDMS